MLQLCLKTVKIAIITSSDWKIFAHCLQEYLPRIADNDVLKAVEKNTSGSRPKELFEEVLEEVEKQWEADRSVNCCLHCQHSSTHCLHVVRALGS